MDRASNLHGWAESVHPPSCWAQSFPVSKGCSGEKGEQLAGLAACGAPESPDGRVPKMSPGPLSGIQIPLRKQRHPVQVSGNHHTLHSTPLAGQHFPEPIVPPVQEADADEPWPQHCCSGHRASGSGEGAG